jgi:hypothetical protein
MKTTTISSYSSTTSPGSSLNPSSTYTYAYKTWAGGATSSTNPPFLNFPRTFKGIVLNNMRALAPLVIGDSTTAGSTNLFDNMDFGIHGTEASAKVHNNYFKNITGSTKQTANGESFPAFGPDEIGIAVAMTHTSTNVHALTVGTIQLYLQVILTLKEIDLKIVIVVFTLLVALMYMLKQIHSRQQQQVQFLHTV